MQRYGYGVNILIDVSVNVDVITMQRYGYGVNILMDISANGDVTTIQRYRCYTCISMNTSPRVNVITMQLGTSCSFDSPGLPNDSGGYPGLTHVVWGTTP